MQRGRMLTGFVDPNEILNQKWSEKLEKHRLLMKKSVLFGGDKWDRTADLLNAIGSNICSI